jgi:HK97 family phage prohead protease
METLRDLDLVRAIPASRKPIELRGEGASGMPLLEVRFSPFNVWYEIDSYWEGKFLERTVRGAFAKTMRESRGSVKVLFDHGYDPSVGNKVLAPIEDLREDADSAVVEGTLFDTSYNRDLLPGLQAGVYGSSFRFRVIQEQWNDEPGASEYNPNGIPERTITEVRLFEAGPVTFPANPDATAGVRSLTDAYYEHLRARQPQRYDELHARAALLRTPTAPAAGDPTAEPDGAASHHDDEPAHDHSARSRLLQLQAALRVRGF